MAFTAPQALYCSTPSVLGPLPAPFSRCRRAVSFLLSPVLSPMPDTCFLHGRHTYLALSAFSKLIEIYVGGFSFSFP